MKTVSRVCNKILYILILILFSTMFGVTVINVFMRFLLNSPIPWAVELGRYTFVAIVYLGAILVMRENGHIGLDIIVEKFPAPVKKVVVIGTRWIVIIFLAVFSFQAARMVITNVNVKSSAMLIPMAIPYSFMVIGGVGMIIEALLNMFIPGRLARSTDSVNTEGGY